MRRRPLLGGSLRALSWRLLLFLRFVLRTGIPVPLGAFLVLLQDLQNRGQGQLRHSALRIYILLNCFVRETGGNLFEVGELDQLHGHFRVLQLHSFAHAGFGVRRGQTDQRLQRSGRDGGGLESRGNNTRSENLKK